ncbi:hypothetical protein VTI28DRAFT_314 [Corynascus sepedonium]
MRVNAYSGILIDFKIKSASYPNTMMNSATVNPGNPAPFSKQRWQFLGANSVKAQANAVLQQYRRTKLPEGTSARHFTHTDTGSITVFFNTECGLRVFPPETEEWEYVPSRDNCAIINVGDSLNFISNFQLKSSLHRVVPESSHWVSESQYATIFFLRASNTVRFNDAEGVNWTGAEAIATLTAHEHPSFVRWRAKQQHRWREADL